MRRLLIPLAAAAVFVPSAASAQEFTPEQLEEMNCIYGALSEDQRFELQLIVFGTDEEALAAELAVGPAMDAASADCAARYGWGEQRILAGADYTMAAVAYEVTYFNLTKSLTEKLDALMSTFPAEYAHTFTLDGQDAIPDYEAWRWGVSQRLAAAGVGEPDFGSSVMYLCTLADVALATVTWENLFVQQVR